MPKDRKRSKPNHQRQNAVLYDAKKLQSTIKKPKPRSKAAACKKLRIPAIAVIELDKRLHFARHAIAAIGFVEMDIQQEEKVLSKVHYRVDSKNQLNGEVKNESVSAFKTMTSTFSVEKCIHRTGKGLGIDFSINMPNDKSSECLIKVWPISREQFNELNDVLQPSFDAKKNRVVPGSPLKKQLGTGYNLLSKNCRQLVHEFFRTVAGFSLFKSSLGIFNYWSPMLKKNDPFVTRTAWENIQGSRLPCSLSPVPIRLSCLGDFQKNDKKPSPKRDLQSLVMSRNIAISMLSRAKEELLKLSDNLSKKKHQDEASTYATIVKAELLPKIDKVLDEISSFNFEQKQNGHQTPSKKDCKKIIHDTSERLFASKAVYDLQSSCVKHLKLIHKKTFGYKRELRAILKDQILSFYVITLSASCVKSILYHELRRASAIISIGRLRKVWTTRAAREAIRGDYHEALLSRSCSGTRAPGKSQLAQSTTNLLTQDSGPDKNPQARSLSRIKI